MPHTDVIPTSASIASTGLGIRYIGHHSYAYSGSVSVLGASSASTTLLNFTTGSGYIKAEIQGFSTERGSAQLYLAVKLNNVLVVNTEFDDAGSASSILDFPIKLIIPPFTKTEVLVGLESGVTKKWSILFTGRVYGEA
jgi:hypothetical protein